MDKVSQSLVSIIILNYNADRNLCLPTSKPPISDPSIKKKIWPYVKNKAKYTDTSIPDFSVLLKIYLSKIHSKIVVATTNDNGMRISSSTNVCKLIEKRKAIGNIAKRIGCKTRVFCRLFW